MEVSSAGAAAQAHAQSGVARALGAAFTLTHLTASGTQRLSEDLWAAKTGPASDNSHCSETPGQGRRESHGGQRGLEQATSSPNMHGILGESPGVLKGRRPGGHVPIGHREGEGVWPVAGHEAVKGDQGSRQGFPRPGDRQQLLPNGGLSGQLQWPPKGSRWRNGRSTWPTERVGPGRRLAPGSRWRPGLGHENRVALVLEGKPGYGGTPEDLVHGACQDGWSDGAISGHRVQPGPAVWATGNDPVPPREPWQPQGRRCSWRHPSAWNRQFIGSGNSSGCLPIG